MRALIVALTVIGLSSAAAAQLSRVPVGGKSPAAATKPLPGTMEEAAAAHVLTLDEVRRLFALMRDHAVQDRRNPGSLDLPEAFLPTLDEAVAGLSRRPRLAALVARHGFTPRSYLVVLSAFNATSATIEAPELFANTEFGATPANLAFYRAHAKEIESLAAEVASADASARAAAETMTAQRPPADERSRLAERASLDVPVDSVRVLTLAIADADERQVEALRHELFCEEVRLGYQHGREPARLAVGRMREALRRDQPTRYRRAEPRLPDPLAALVYDANKCGTEKLTRTPYAERYRF